MPRTSPGNCRRRVAPRRAPFLVTAIALLCLQSVSGRVSGRVSAAEPGIDYAKQIQPLLRTRCFACHGPLKQQSGLRLDASQLIRKGGESGPLLVPGKPDESLLIDVVTGEAGFLMPPPGEGTRLKADEVQLLRDWIAQGAQEVLEDPRKHWSYQPPVRPAVPTVRNAALVRNPIDAFVAAKHEELGLTPVPEADRATLLRRVTIDLTGLPPTAAELDAFLRDDSPRAYERAVDRLLENPRYGQRWGRHWMDVWRYADWYGSRGINEIRYSQRHIWRWRDWIIDSLNADRGYDRMLQEMLAADELAAGNADALRATGFLGRNWYKFDRNVWLRDTVEYTAAGVLGLTLRCARCHDHKYDPVSQEEYYRFRAFFEPHSVRVDVLSAAAGLQKDATLGMVPLDGVSRVFDEQLEQPTYLFSRGDDRFPEKDRPLAPGVPAALGGSLPEIAAIDLPLEGWYPALHPELIASRQQDLQQKLAAAEAAVTAQQLRLAAAEQRHREVAAAEAAAGDTKPAAGTVQSIPTEETLFHDDFDALDPNIWQPVNGAWAVEAGDLVQSRVGTFHTINAAVELPRDFRARVRYTCTDPGGLHSTGFSFDVHGSEAWQAVYTHSRGTTSGIQAFHRSGGVNAYPKAGVFPDTVHVGEEIVLDVAVRGSLLNVWHNGQLKIAYEMPLARRPGGLALWVHSGTARFHEVLVATLPEEFALTRKADQVLRSPFEPLTAESLSRTVASHRAQLEILQLKREVARAEQESVQARTAADMAKYSAADHSATLNASTWQPLAEAAFASQQKLAVSQARVKLAEAEQQLADVRRQSPNGTSTDGQPAAASRTEAMQQAEAKAQKAVAAARKALDAAIAAQKKSGTNYEPLGKEYPKTSTGRRLALAQWITSPQNPRTARVAVNHMWLRHFGQALVPSVASFGLAGKDPSHPKLLDWLAVELTGSTAEGTNESAAAADGTWRMKHLHRLMVTSSAYRRASAAGPQASGNLDIDPQNTYLWRMNSRRMEAEAVRDSVLYLAGRLDESMGGPEIAESQGQVNLRRSLYFRTTPNESMEFLDLFDLASPNECYDRKPSVVPQQVLAMTNSALATTSARMLAGQILQEIQPTAGTPANPATTDIAFIEASFRHVLCRMPTEAERTRCAEFLAGHTRLLQQAGKLQRFPSGGAQRQAAAADPALRAKENLVQVLFNHNDFVTIR